MIAEPEPQVDHSRTQITASPPLPSRSAHVARVCVLAPGQLHESHETEMSEERQMAADDFPGMAVLGCHIIKLMR